MRVYYWQPRHKENFGDYLNVPILAALGHRAELPMAGRPCLFALGSILNADHFRRCPGRPIVVCGSGLLKPDDPLPADIRVLAVRGPLTRDFYKLPSTLPLGDPALLVPQLYVSLSRPEQSGEVLYINHCSADPLYDLPGCDASLSTVLNPEEVLPLVARIASASFVASESLHGCILAAAYGVPWAFTSHRWRQDFSGISKITDWMTYLGLPPLRFAAATLSEAKYWWEKTGRLGKLRDTRPILDLLATLDL